MRRDLYVDCLVIKTGKFKIANWAMVFALMKMVCVLNMTMYIIGVYNIMNIFNSIKPKEYAEKKQGTDSSES